MMPCKASLIFSVQIPGKMPVTDCQFYIKHHTSISNYKKKVGKL